ncbi:alpha/beta fold hydrolase [Streptomyces bauhiniae]|uniref:alpha/beta fold hydrolase n=1 Tax=Streptomyces bauhiniae TaxID=2340725 RepID=UPI00364FCBB3
MNDLILPSGFARRSADVNGTQLSYLYGGSGPAVVLLHGWPQTSLAWRYVLEPLASSGYTVVAPDLRGLGHSAHAESGYDKDNQSEDIRQLLHSLGLGPQVRVVGHDIGAMVAFSYARRHPDDVEHLVVMDVAIPGLGLEKAMDVAHGGLWHFGLFMAHDVPELLFDGHERDFFAWWFRRLAVQMSPFTPEIMEDVTRSYSGREALRCGFEHYRTLLDDGKINRAWADAGHQLSMPVLAVGGERGAGARLGESLRPVAPQIKIDVVGACGHFVAEEQPEALVSTLTDFFASP